MNADINARNIWNHTYCWQPAVARRRQMEKLSPCFGSITELHACNLASSTGQPAQEQVQAQKKESGEHVAMKKEQED